MRITIDNLDGLGARDYTDAVVVNAKGASTLVVERGLNVPSRCACEVDVSGSGLPSPARLGRVVVSAQDGTLLFTGYLAAEPVQEYFGETTAGVQYRAKLTAVGDEWLLDRLGPVTNKTGETWLGLEARQILGRLMSRVGGASALLLESGVTAVQTLPAFTIRPNAAWSEVAGEAANEAYAAYRAIDGKVSLQPVGSVTHVLSDDDGSLDVAELQTSHVRELINDVTLSGDEEPTAYISEVFSGDGTTTAFALSEAAFRESASKRALLRDNFDEAAFDASQWAVSDPGNALSITSAGLTMNGGNGLDGQTTLTALNSVELGGSLMVQMSGVTFGAGSAGLLGGMYQGPTSLPNCFAGFRVRQNSGATVVVPVVNGVEVGTLFTPAAGHRYTLRMRLHCAEMQRVMQSYSCMVDGAVQMFGGASNVAAPMDVVFDLVDEGASSNTPATVLYDSAAAGAAIGAAPATCAFVAVNALKMFGTVASVEVTRSGSMWVVRTLPDGTKQTRLIGSAGEGVDCAVSYGSAGGSNGEVVFFAGRVPVAGELVTVSYRGVGRALARMADAVSVAEEASSGLPGTCRWVGKVLRPEARSSVDCESAAQALLAVGTSRSAALAGNDSLLNPAADVWPGDVLQVERCDATSGTNTLLSLLVRSVTVQDGGAEPEVLRYKIAFANDIAGKGVGSPGISLSDAVPADAVIPATAMSCPAEVLANLQHLQVTAISGTALTMDAGVDPPAGGGFEVRHRDAGFSASDAADLVLRSPVRSFSVPRAAQVERFYVRMYDAGSPRLYSRFSSAVFVDVPLG